MKTNNRSARRTKTVTWVVFVADEAWPHECAGDRSVPLPQRMRKGEPTLTPGPWIQPGPLSYAFADVRAIAYVDHSVAYWRALGWACHREIRVHENAVCVSVEVSA